METTDQLNARLRPLVAGYYENHDEAALGKLLEILRPVLVRYARAKLGVRDAERAEDAAQDGLLQVLLSLREGRLTGEGSIVSYAMTCCQCRYLTSIGRFAARTARPGLDDDPYLLLGETVAQQPADLALSADYEAEASTALAGATGAVLQLDPNARAAVVLHYYQGLPMAQAAAQLGINLSRFVGRLTRGLATLRAWGEAHPLSDEAGVYANLPRVNTGDLFTEPLRLAS